MTLDDCRRPLFACRMVAAVAEWYRYRTVAYFVTGSSPVPLKTRRVGQRCTLNLSRAETSSRWCGVVDDISGSSPAAVVLGRPPPTFLTAVPVVWNAFQTRETTLLLIPNSAATLVTVRPSSSFPTILPRVKSSRTKLQQRGIWLLNPETNERYEPYYQNRSSPIFKTFRTSKQINLWVSCCEAAVECCATMRKTSLQTILSYRILKTEVNKGKIRYILQFFFDKSENASYVAEIVNAVYGPDTVTANYVQFMFFRFSSRMPVVENVDNIAAMIEVDRSVGSRSITQELKIDHYKQF
ncbi:calcitonin gene-related peptide type 1 receptor [Trichonephila clavipes]|nr:calcitonin gene-related peptide type 1 receptor [Trichonephila clavipes]